MNHLAAPHFRDETAARLYVEGLRWPNGPVCPHCEEAEKRYATKREGRYRCGNSSCRKDFTVTTRTVMESSHLGLTKWLMAFYLMSASKKGMSALQLSRMLGITYKAAWFMAHRVREAMAAGGLVPMGGGGTIIEADETYFGKVGTPKTRGAKGPYTKRGSGPANKRPIVSLVERGGSIRSFHVAVCNKDAINRILTENALPDTRLHTDESRLYTDAKHYFDKHETVKHSAGEYARGDVYTNTLEGYFSIFKRGMRGVYQHCAEKHLHRYLSEFDFRYNGRKISDLERAALALKGAEGKRLTYRQPHGAGLFASSGPFPSLA